jgi:hypothetical protein
MSKASRAPEPVRYPNTEGGADCPALPIQDAAIQIACEARISSHGPFVVAGSFRVGDDDVQTLGAEPHRGLVLVVWREPFYHASAPFQSLVLFPDDVVTTPAGRVGHFHVDVLAHSQFRTPGTWYVSVSLATHVSNTLVVKVT